MTDSVLIQSTVIKLTGESRVVSQHAPPSASEVTRRQDQETGRRLANKYAEEAMLEMVNLMRQTKDENVKIRACKMIMDRAWGQTKPLTEEEKKGADAGSILDILAQVSVTQTQIENEARGHAVAKQTELIEGESTVLDAEDFLAEVERERSGG